ncbi:MAG: response regulator [Calditrichia bacterium]|nr:response regulator [Calditrichia bacterium]
MCEKIRVLIIDDETSIRQSLKGFFEDYEFKVKTASSAEEAIKTLKTETFDAAIVDLRLPGMNGDLFILKTYSKYPKMAFIIYTGSVNFHLTTELLDIGILNEYIFLKPLTDLTVLVNKVEQLVKEKKNAYKK